MTSAKEIARAFVEMILSEDIEYLDVQEFAQDYDNGETDVNYQKVYERVCEYMDELRIGFQNGK